jgi:hypothetical protein
VVLNRRDASVSPVMSSSRISTYRCAT